MAFQQLFHASRLGVWCGKSSLRNPSWLSTVSTRLGEWGPNKSNYCQLHGNKSTMMMMMMMMMMMLLLLLLLLVLAYNHADIWVRVPVRHTRVAGILPQDRSWPQWLSHVTCDSPSDQAFRKGLHVSQRTDRVRRLVLRVIPPANGQQSEGHGHWIGDKSMEETIGYHWCKTQEGVLCSFNPCWDQNCEPKRLESCIWPWCVGSIWDLEAFMAGLEMAKVSSWQPKKNQWVQHLVPTPCLAQASATSTKDSLKSENRVTPLLLPYQYHCFPYLPH